MYSALTPEDQKNVHAMRLLELEREHYRYRMLLEEMLHCGTPDSSESYVSTAAKLPVLDTAIEHQRRQLGLIPRVEDEPEPEPRDDDLVEEVADVEH